MLVEAGLKPQPGVNQAYYGGVESRLDNAIDAINRVGDLLIAINSPKGKRPPRSKPQRRPKSAYTRIEHETRMTRHKALANRVLPNGSTIDQAPAARVAGQRRRDRRVLEGIAVPEQLASNAFVKKGEAATREEERQARWADRARQVGRVRPESDDSNS